MKLTTAALIGASLFCTAPAWCGTIFGGFEDSVGSDYDYNDLVFSMTGTSLTMIAPGASLFSEPVLNGGIGSVGAHNGTPFWNNESLDGTTYNVGYCIYGGGTCNGGAGLDPTADYLATSSTSATGSADNVTFSVNGSVGTTVSLDITSDHDILGWYNVSNPSVIYWLDQTGPVTGMFSFTPTGTFGLVANNSDGAGTTFYSQTALGDGNDPSGVSHFAFFEDPPTAPEPSTMFLLGAALMGLGAVRRPAFLHRGRKS